MENKYKVLLLGSGGREHALADAISKSNSLESLKVFPGNGGFSSDILLSPNEISITDKSKFFDYIKSSKTNLVVVGPEDPLVNGIADWCDEIGVPCFGPSAYCAQVEGSKHFAKEMMKRAKVPTASFAVFTDHESAWSYAQKELLPLVVKADGLAAGKGVTVAFELKEVKRALDEIFLESKFGQSGNKVVIESFLEGEEASLFVITDGERYMCLPAAQDHKRAYDGDIGPNTGGMGAYAPAPIVTDAVLTKVKSLIIEPMLGDFKRSGHPYKGLLYVGLMITKEGEPNVVEFNCRFGDPETQCVLRLIDEDILPIFYASATGNLPERNLKLKQGSSAVVVLAAKGYPDSPEKGMTLEIPPNEGNVVVYHAGTKKENSSIIANGGRILGITSFGDSLKNAIDECYVFLGKIKAPNTFYRKDIGRRAL
ncbi:phosphoribosylamine--glycine ligase [Leptospira yanagawae serovar Saopaulo str. Sao Paulo = ATCC 700523]|uniref:Phosphoribosylamine--glycine ligase n=1 Tax=Leptospira yanagawae serovar Saopaulo str. Sao Paulo = ATCC 700523 TaxID=1249483 RepID=A0A5E8HFD2_9LEPT|nr:phosphoribosylamine--glycine ligase [Leptospira yanagawae]EOQ89995.1 phosphoribosylamine--glycine ligase [Leptospira yanagawae serovar Saopaulo str. Sao Paulo = ATCC 700523]